MMQSQFIDEAQSQYPAKSSFQASVIEAFTEKSLADADVADTEALLQMVQAQRDEESSGHKCRHGHPLPDESSRLSQLDNEVQDLEQLINEMKRLKESLKDDEGSKKEG